MRKLLSLPPNLVGSFHDVTGLSREEFFCTNDPIGHKLGSGGGTTWLLQACCQADGAEDISTWLSAEKRILLHAGGQSRRLPAYAPSGKVLTPIPVFRWERGQRLSQDLLSLQLPLYEKIMAMAPESIHTMVVSGGQEPWGIRQQPSDTLCPETHVAETLGADPWRTAERAFLSDGYRHLAAERQGC